MPTAAGLIEKAKASVGDRVKIKKGSQVFEGVLLPSAGEFIQVKLASGYNTGIAPDAQTTLELLEKGKPKLGKAVSLELEQTKGLPEISFIATGGTIASRVDYDTGAVKWAMTPQEIFSSAPELANVVSVKTVHKPFTLGSEDMSPKEWAAIAELVAKDLNAGASGAIVTHGTDTLHYTSAALSFMLKGLEKPVAVVGAQRSPDRGSFDGALNLLCSAHYAKSDFAEVAIVMHGTSSDDYCLCHRGTKVRKMHSSRRDAFKSINDKPLAKIFADGKIEKTNATAKMRKRAGDDAGKVVVDAVFEEKTALVKVFPGANPEILDFFAEKNRGIVLEATAFGHVPTNPLDKSKSWIPAVKRAVDKGVFVAVASQCLYGTTGEFVYANGRLLADAGAFFCKDMLPETAYVKLGWVLGHTKKGDAAGAREKMAENVAGEYNLRLTEEEFL
ncbi:MAG: Glu-tRNA(Gln) amidotransferase subunit GatD [Candidatus Micrarchaeia archaeon]|jgi:glutamyl-tRNA(Gln) amidotransferase subunit D